MLDPTAPPRAPRVLDENAQQADRLIFAALHQATARAAEPMFLDRFASLGATGLADDFMRQAETLRTFLLADARDPPSAQGDIARHELRQHLSGYLQECLSEGEAAAADRALAQQLAAEFAGSVWATLVSRLNRHHASDGLVDPHHLLPDNLLTGETPLLKQVREDARHFGLSPEEINLVMAATLSSLVNADSADQAFLRWPRGLRVDRQALKAHVLQAQATHRSDFDLNQQRAVQMAHQALVQRGMD